MLESLFSQFENIVVLDLETTGLDARRDEIIEFGALRVSSDGAQTEDDVLIRLAEGNRLPPAITKLTGITEDRLFYEGVEKNTAAGRIRDMLEAPNTLIVTYNAQFDLCFLFYFLKTHGGVELLKNARLYDALTVYRDRRDYPHRLENAVEAYALETQNTHRAIDDARATLELLAAMEQEHGDLSKYIDLFGYNPRYGVPKPKISSVTYRAQPYERGIPLYERSVD